MRGQDLSARADVVEDDEGVTHQLLEYLRQVPKLAKHFDVSLDSDGRPNRDAVAKAARERVIVLTTVET